MTIANPYDGQGGSYSLDPETGKVTLIQRTELFQPIAEESSAPVNAQTPDPGETGDDLRDGFQSSGKRRSVGPRPEHHSGSVGNGKP